MAALCTFQVCVEVVGYLLEELRDPTNFAAFQKDMEDANVFIGSLIFIEELAEKVSHKEEAHRCGQPLAVPAVLPACPKTCCGLRPDQGTSCYAHQCIPKVQAGCASKAHVALFLPQAQHRAHRVLCKQGRSSKP